MVRAGVSLLEYRGSRYRPNLKRFSSFVKERWLEILKRALPRTHMSLNRLAEIVGFSRKLLDDGEDNTHTLGC